MLLLFITIGIISGAAEFYFTAVITKGLLTKNISIAKAVLSAAAKFIIYALIVLLIFTFGHVESIGIGFAVGMAGGAIFNLILERKRK